MNQYEILALLGVLGLLTAAELPVGAWIQVRSDTVIVLGEVRYCQADGAGNFQVGVTVHEDRKSTRLNSSH